MVLKGHIGVTVDITEISNQDGLIFGEVDGSLVSELEALVDFDLQNDVGCEGSPREEVVELALNVLRVDSLDLTIGSLGDRADGIDVTFRTNDCHDMNSHSLGFRVLTAHRVEGLDFILIISTADTFVRHPVSADNYL